MMAFRPNGPMRFFSRPVVGVEDLALPGKILTNWAISGLKAVPGAMMAVPSASSFRDRACFAGGEQRIELRLRHAEKLRHIVGHLASPFAACACRPPSTPRTTGHPQELFDLNQILLPLLPPECHAQALPFDPRRPAACCCSACTMRS